MSAILWMCIDILLLHMSYIVWKLINVSFLLKSPKELVFKWSKRGAFTFTRNVKDCWKVIIRRSENYRSHKLMNRAFGLCWWNIQKLFFWTCNHELYTFAVHNLSHFYLWHSVLFQNLSHITESWVFRWTQINDETSDSKG